MTNSQTVINDEKIIDVNNSKKSKLMNLVRAHLDSMPSLFYRKRESRLFSTGLVGYDFTKTREYQQADIIHMHWVNDGFVNMRHIAKINKPIVWTMRDMWPMTGGCHYAIDCDRYLSGCGHCKQLGSRSGFDLSRFVINRKKKYLSPKIKLIGISFWLSEQARKSDLFNGYDIKTIHNGINTEDFFQVERETARKSLGIETGKKIVLCGSIYMGESHKGFDKYLQAVSYLDKDKVLLVFFGGIEQALIKETGFEYRVFGYLGDNISLRLLYSASDVFVAPSLMDAFGKTISESMACGTPAVCFDATGPKDIVDHKINGYKARPYSAEDLAAGIKWVLQTSDYQQLSANACKKVKENFSNTVIAQKYIELYQKMLCDVC